MITNEITHFGANLAVSCFIGLAIGLERSISSKLRVRTLGIRDFLLVSIMAFIASYMNSINSLAWPIAFIGVICYSLIRTYFSSLQKGGVSTAITLPIAFLIAGLPNFGVDRWLVATLLFTIISVLVLKDQIHSFGDNFKKTELIDLALLIAITITITPLIPEKASLPIPLLQYKEGSWALTFEHIKLMMFWKVIIMVSLMSFGSHFITKYIKGKNALLLATYFGGLVSSLATIMLLLSKSGKVEKKPISKKNLFLGYVSANTGSITKDMVVFFVVVGAARFEQYLFPLTSILLLFVVITMYSFARTEPQDQIKIADRPLPLSFVLKFSAVFAGVMIFMTMVTYYLGSDAMIIASFLSGMISSAASLAAIGNSLINHDITTQIAGYSAIAASLGSISAKYLVISKSVGLLKSRRFVTPIVVLALIGFTTMWLSLAPAGSSVFIGK
jgi:uncharacterized membrane protein (DUF4010 family)